MPRDDLPRAWLEDLRVMDLLHATCVPAMRYSLDSSPAVGSVALSSARSVVQSFTLVAWALKRWPWLVPCVAVPPGQHEAAMGLELIADFDGRIATCSVAECFVYPNRGEVRRATGRRPPPTPGALAGYVAHRTHRPALECLLEEQFEWALAGVRPRLRSTATYSRAFARHGSYNARDWRRLAGLVWRLVDPDAVDRGLCALTEQRLCRRYLCMAPARVRDEVPAWEHVLEVALRCGGYVPAFGMGDVGGSIRPTRLAPGPGSFPGDERERSPALRQAVRRRAGGRAVRYPPGRWDDPPGPVAPPSRLPP